MWREGNRIHLETKVAETGKSVLTGAYIDLKSVASAPAAIPTAAPSASSGLLSETVFGEMKRRLDAQPEVGAKINAVYQWIILSNKKPAGSWGKILSLSVKKPFISDRYIVYEHKNYTFHVCYFSCGFEGQAR